MLLSDDTLSEQKLDSVVLSNRCTYNEEIHDTSLLGKSLLNIYYPVHGQPTCATLAL